MSSIVFQEIRESKGLAYSSFASYSLPDDTLKMNTLFSYIGTQPDKMELASTTMLGLLNKMPQAEESFKDSKNAIKKRMRTERYKFSDIFWSYLYAKRMGLSTDGKKELYNALDNYQISDVSEFFDKHVKNKPYTMIVIGSKDHVDFKTLEKFGKVKEVTMEELFPRY
jgi:predicted Zn-dependent peptidase